MVAPADANTCKRLKLPVKLLSVWRGGLPTILVLLTTALLSACDLPRDPEHTLDRVQGGVMRVGLIEHPPWVDRADAEPDGVEVTLIRQFAKELDAEIRWIRGPEADLMRALQHAELDAVIGGLTRSTPWRRENIGFTRPYYRGRTVIAIPPGENAWLMRMERFLRNREGAVRRMLTGQVGA